MAGFGFHITRNDISPKLAKLARRAKNPEKVLRAMGTTFLSIIMGNFNSVGQEYRPKPWAPKRDGSESKLQKSNTLAGSFHLSVTRDRATVSNPTVYAAIHQFGGVITPKNKKVLVFQSGGKTFAVKRVVMPARPFFPVVNGKLTPKAEEKIHAAGMRAMERDLHG